MFMHGKPLILVVEPNLHELEILNSYLKKLEFSCMCAKQGVRALIMAQTHKPDLIFLDMVLPDLSSIQVIYYLKRNPETNQIPIIGLTSGSSAEDFNPLLQTGAVDCIAKPFNFHQIQFCLRRHLSLLHSFN
ncbi:two-component system response regulator [Fischerella major NIES-592]|uniref:Two-component system response regulator n=2 Tax=Fischerella TaxID=1190 RepID=A0A1U7GUS2_9CYAN|nr:two-component system response regulator [Fischerella major NIES-592]